ncbi:MBL fold hydrolase [Pseudothermotoga thermarum]|uniref:RNA-metabolising metallo-beta-lactamase n=1 Tax=Pseudothermotoga thermarum DSM 5069 TaxID=688269 RepID=F7YV06_9THEM|nr:MBL fold hydrolase [Pseudothermotoga thermarum]AEH50290.1 RNA-metabolising metallo-beta-lactamase [Pseudothermotoga thermarum DSM 5069]
MLIKVLDGHETIGGNKILVADKSNKGFLLDFGLNFTLWSLFFEEFVQPRTGRILADLSKLELIPKLDIYREDLNPPCFDDSIDVKFLFISHAHADHCGMIGLIKPDIPLLMTNETLAIMKANSDLKQDLIAELYPRKRVKPSDPLIRSDLTEITRSKSEKFQKRKVCIIGSLNTKDQLEERFIFTDPSDLWDDRLIVQRAYHSVIGAAGLIVKVDGLWVAYTGDFRLGPRTKEEESFWFEHFGPTRLELAKRTSLFFDVLRDKKPLLLITEGTRVARKTDSETTEKDVYEKALELVGKTNKLVIADFPVRHLERLLTFLLIACKTERYLVLMPKDYAYLIMMEQIEPAWKLSEEERKQIKVYHVAKVQFSSFEEQVLKQAIEEGILIGPDQIESNPSKYIVCAGYWEIPMLLDLDPSALEGSIYIHSTSEAYTEEQLIDTKRLGNWLKKFFIQPFGIRFEDGEAVFTKEFHASGHISAEDLEEFINSLEPDYILPVHTEEKEWFVERWGKEKIILKNMWYT